MLSKLVSPKVTNSGRPFQLATQARGRLKCSVPDTDPSPALTTPIQSIPNPRVRPTHILRQPARPLGEKKETILVQIEEDHQDVDQFEYVQQKGNWQGHNIYLKQLLVNKNYAHAFDYWKTLRNFGPTPDTLTYNTYFALVEVAGSPYDIIDTFYDFDEHNILRVQAQPDATSFAFLIKAHCTLRNLPAALDVLQRMADLGITPVQRSFAMILDLCADQALFEEGRVVLERVKAEIFENESVNQNVDIEVMNSVMFFLGSHTITEGEKYFHSIIRAGIQMSYNTYQRLIELYLKANRPQDIARIVHLMKNDGFTPNAELTKYTLMEAFIETGDKAILNSITSTYPKPTFQREQHYKFFYDFISKYIAGGGPVYIPEGFLDIATPDELEQLYVQVIAQEVGVIPHVGEQLDSYGRTTVDLNELLSEDDIDDQLEPQEEENDINEIMEDKKHSLQLDIDDEDSHFERLEEEIWSGKPSRRDDESSYSYDYGSDNYSEQVTDEAAAKELTILPSGKNYMEDSDHQDYDMTNEDESRDSDEEERRSSGEGGSSDIGVEPEELWAESSQQNSKRASGSSSSARARSVLDAPGEEGEGKSDGGGSQQLEVMQQAAAQEKGDEVSDGTRQAALEGGAEFEEDFDDLLDFGEGGDGGGPDGRPIDDVEEEPSEGAEDSRSRPWRRRKAKAPHMPKLEDSDPFDAENDFHRDEPDARYLEILRQLEVSPAEFAARKEKEQVQEWLELDEMSDENPDVFQRGVYPEALVQQSTELYNILEEEDIKEVAQAIKESQEDDSDSDATGPHASPKDVIKSEWEHAVTESGQSTPDAVFGSEQYEYQSAVESLQAVESDYARRKAALDQKREAEGGAKKKTAKATTTSGNTDDSAPQQDVSESSSEGEFAYDRESVSDEAEATPSALDRVFTADYLFPAKLTKQTPREAKEFRQRFEAVPGYDPIAQQIDDNSIGGIMANPGRIDKMAKPSIKEPTESEIDKAHVRRMYLTKIKKRYEEAKAKGASKVELNKIREVFNQVKKTRVTQEEVDDFDSKMELYEHHLKHENPKKYKELYAMYLMDTKRDSSGFDDPVLSAETGHHPMEVMEAQMSAIDDFYVDAEMPHDDNVFIDAVRQFDHRNPEDPDMKRLVLRWGKNVQEMNNTDLDQAYQRTRMASINVLMPNQPQRKWTGNPDDIMWNLGDDSDDHNYL